MIAANAIRPKLDALPIWQPVPKRDVTLWQLLQWTYRDQRAHRYLDCQAAWFEYLVRMAAPTDDTPRAPVHRDAALVHSEIVLLGLHGELLQRAALSGEVPARCTEQPMPERPAVDRRADRFKQITFQGRKIDVKVEVAERVAEVVPVYERRGRKLVQVGSEIIRHDVEYCPVDWFPDPSFVDLCDRVATEFEQAWATLAPRAACLKLSAHTIVGLDIPGGVP